MLALENKGKLETLVALVIFCLVVFLRKFTFSSLNTSGIWELLIFSVLILLFLPIITIKKIFKEKISDYNLKINKQIYKIIPIVVIVFLLVWFIMLKLNWPSYFQVSVWLLENVSFVYFLDLLIVPIVVFSGEFFFRGFLLETIRRGWGGSISVLATTMLAFGYGAFFSNELSWLQMGTLLVLNLLLTIIAYLGRSVIVTFVLNWMILLSVDYMALEKLSRLGK